MVAERIVPSRFPFTFQPRTKLAAKPNSSAPAMPRRMVRNQPWGSDLLPGTSNFAKVPATRPTMMNQMKSILYSDLIGGTGVRPPGLQADCLLQYSGNIAHNPPRNEEDP